MTPVQELACYHLLETAFGSRLEAGGCLQVGAVVEACAHWPTTESGAAGGRLSWRFRPQGQEARLGEAASMGPPSGRHQLQGMADVSISGSEAGPSGRQAIPDDDTSLYTHRSNRSATWSRHGVIQVHV